MKRTAFVTSLGVGLVVLIAACDAMVPTVGLFQVTYFGDFTLSEAHGGETINIVVVRIDPTVDTLVFDTVVVVGPDSQTILTAPVGTDRAFEFLYADLLNPIADHLLYYYIDTNGNGVCDDPATDHHRRETDNLSRGDWFIQALEIDAGTTDLCFGFNF